MKKLLLLNLFLLVFSLCYSQNSFRNFLPTVPGYSNKAIDLKLTNDGGFVILESQLYDKDNTCKILLTKLNAAGNPIWTKTFNSQQLSSEAAAMVVDPFNENILVAFQGRSGMFTDTKFGLVNNNGSLIGDTIYTLDIDELEEVTSIAKSKDGGFVLTINAGKQTGNSFGNLIKLKSDLSLDWKIKDSSNSYSKVIGHSSGAFICIGNEKMIKYNSIGGKVWEKVWLNINLNGLTEISDSSILAVCQGVPMQLIKVSPSGNELFKKDYSGTGSPAIYPTFYDITETVDKKLILAGSNNAGTLREYFVIKTSNTGAIEWSRTFHGPTIEYVNRFVSVKFLKNKGLALLAKFDNNVDGYDDRSAFYLTDSIGIVRRLSVDKDQINIDKPIIYDDGKGGKGSLTFSQVGNLNKLKINIFADSIATPASPDFRFIKRFIDIDIDTASGYKAEMNFTVYQDELNGIQPGALIFQRFDELNNQWQSINARSIVPSFGTSYIANLKQITQFSRWTMGWGVNNVSDLTNKPSIKCYPNPGNGNFYLDFGTPIAQEIKIEIINMQGVTMFEETYQSQSSNILNISNKHLASGLYQIKVINANKVSLLKYVVQ
jgi:hypothetical protein